MITMKHFTGAFALTAAFALWTGCSDDDDSTPGSEGTARIEITDAPIDDAGVQGVFVTVTSVEVDGEAVSGFTAQTIDLMAYQNGDTKLLGDIQLEAGTYNDVTLVLDYAQDANGNSPGAYVLTQGNVKHSLQAGSAATGEIKAAAGDFEVTDSATTTVVLDFDLRKSIRYDDAPQANDQYDFVTEAELRTSLRTVVKTETGKIQGKVEDNLNVADRVVVYAYKKGSFNQNTETSGQGSSQIEFKNAVTSAVAGQQGNYTLSFLEEGDYELHFFAYDDDDNNGKMELAGELDVNLLGSLGIDLNNVSVDAGASVSLNVSVVGILP